MKVLFQLLYNLGILVSISIISGFIVDRGNKGWYKSLLQGVLFGIASIIGMLNPLVVAPGLIFDGRSVMISLSAMLFGPITAMTAATMALLLRIQQGGVGTIMGVFVIIESAIIGTFFHAYNKKHNGQVKVGQLYNMGIIVHIIMVLLMLTLPGDKSISTIKLIGLPVLFLYPLATILIGRIIIESKERRRIGEALKASEYTFRKLFEGSSDAILIMDDYIITDCNKATIELLNYDSKDIIIGKNPWEFSPERQPDGQLSKEKALEYIDATLKNKNLKFEWWHLKYDGTLIPVEIMMTAILLNNKQVFHILWRDISERKQIEGKLEYLSYNDQLTNLYNRRFFEAELKRLDVDRNYPLSIIMADVNGLKLINDSFGHAIGDELLKKVAEVIKKGCRTDDIIARLGGDEFVILLPKTDANQTEQIINRIKELSSNEKIGSVYISVSYGYEIKYNKNDNINEILKKAEDQMYKKKLFESPSMRGKTINAIINTLHEKNNREEAHSQRVSTLCISMGKAIGLHEGEIEELKTIGLLHDIGKIAIEENILNKPAKLTDNEWKEIKRHPEIGYRIINTVNDMSDMAIYILYHHERWDGTGYPKGLIGNDIPFVSRIISIVDTYDAITSERSYRSALPKEFAIEELQKNAGIQFDPELVKIFIEKVLEVQI